MQPVLHVVSFDVPFPANYGGVIDVYHKLRCLKKAGVKIYLHCFVYGRKESPELAQLCEQVWYYPRHTGWRSNLSWLPYTVKSRQSEALRSNLLKVEAPILFEVLHTCALLADPELRSRKKIYRHSNIEHHYYRELAKSERSFLKRWYLTIEAKRLEAFETILEQASLILAVNRKDCDYFKSKYPKVRSEYLPSFHSNDAMQIREGKGKYLLFHGNLSVSENYEALEWLIREVFSKVTIPVVVAGLNPPAVVQSWITGHEHITLIPNPDEPRMEELIREAHVHVLYTNQSTGLKLKLLNVLYKGRHVVLNSAMLSGTGIQAGPGVVVAEQAETFRSEILALMDTAFDDTALTYRAGILQPFDNKTNTDKFIDLVFS